MSDWFGCRTESVIPLVLLGQEVLLLPFEGGFEEVVSGTRNICMVIR